MDLPVRAGEVQRDASENITKFAIVDRFSGDAKVAKMFWRGCGPRTPDTALACSVAHDKHNIWVTGSSDDAMATAVNALVETKGGWALVRDGRLAATVRFEIGGLMSCRPAEELDRDMQNLYAEARKVDWMYEPTYRPRWEPGFPERLMFATLTCAPWTWVLVAPCPEAPEGFINVQTGEPYPVVW
jgi:adenine deaminase